MAVLKDKREPVDIYAPGTPTSAAQNKMNSLVGNSTAALAGLGNTFNERMLGGAGARAAVNATVAPVVNRLASDSQNQQQVLGTMANKRDRAAMGAAWGGGSRVVQQSSPSSELQTTPSPMVEAIPTRGTPTSMAATAPNRLGKIPLQASHGLPAPTQQTLEQQDHPGLNPGEGWIRNESTGETVSLQGNKIVTKDRNGAVIPEVTSRLTGYHQNQPGGPSAFEGIQRVGNMDVSFDSSVSPETQQAFLENPVRPTGQMAQYERTQPQRLAAQSGFADRRAAEIAGDGRIDFENMTPGQRRFAVANQEIADNRRKLGIEDRRNVIAEQGNNQQFVVGQSRLASDQALNQANIDKAGVETQAAQMGIDQAKKLAALQDEYTNTTDEKRRKQLESQIYAIQGKPIPKPQIVTKKGVAADGITPTETSYIFDPENPGAAVEIGAGGNAQALTLPADEKSMEVGKDYTGPDGNIHRKLANGQIVTKKNK